MANETNQGNSTKPKSGTEKQDSTLEDSSSKRNTWVDAIVKVLAENSNTLMHVDEIAEKIKSDNLYTPRAKEVRWRGSVEAICHKRTDIFQKVDQAASYVIKQDVYDSFNQTGRIESQGTVPEEKQEDIEKEIDKLSENRIIKSYGMFWLLDNVLWTKNPTLWGKELNTNSNCIDFANQIGIYLLHDVREIIYVGQVSKGKLGSRLFDHTRGAFGGRWDRFSWFGLRGVDSSGHLTKITDSYEQITTNSLINAFESILIEIIEPRKNNNKAPETGTEYVQPSFAELQAHFSSTS